MLVLRPEQLESAAEDALFAELAGWETGGAVRGAVVASLPVVDGPMRRRQADAVLFVPEGLAVVRAVEVVRQSGVVTAVEEGAWTIGPGAGPGDVLRLAGGGSTPLDGLMRAGMDAAVRLRRAGLEPGRIARLTVLHGELTGLIPADGDLGEGDLVALVEPRSLLLSIARTSRHTGTDNPRLWTTADVRAALEALGMQGRAPTVEELNGEGFPYSPYVLRRPDLLTPAALAAAPRYAAPTAAGQGEPGPLVDPAAAGRVAAAAVKAQEADEAEADRGAAARADRLPPRDPAAARTPPTEAIAGPAAPPGFADETGGIGGIFAAPSAPAAPTRPSPARPAPGHPVQPPALPRTMALQSPLGAPQPATRTSPRTGAASAGARPADGWQGGAWQDAGWQAAPQPAPPRRRRTLLVVAAAVFLVLVLAGGVLFLQGLRDPGGAGTAARSSAPSSAPTSAAGTPTGPQDANGVMYTQQAAEADTSCQDHSYGAVQEYFATTDCTGLSRALFSAEVDGAPAVVAVSQVTMPDTASAQALRALADSNGTGNVSDLLREGTRYDGAPERLDGQEYASSQRGNVVTVVEAAWSGQPGGGGSDALEGLAQGGLQLTLPAVAGD